LFFEKFTLAAHPDPGRASTIELQNAEMLGRWGNLPPRLFSGHNWSPAPIPDASGEETQQASWSPVDGNQNCLKAGTRKEKGRRDERAATERV
jgi:hypothetical protein